MQRERIFEDRTPTMQYVLSPIFYFIQIVFFQGVCGYHCARSWPTGQILLEKLSTAPRKPDEPSSALFKAWVC